MLIENGEVRIPNGELDEALVSLLELPELPELEAPDDMDLEQEPSEPQPRLVLEPLPVSGWNSAPLLARLTFLYGELEVNAEDLRPAIVDWEEGRYARRDIDRERESVVRLVELGLRPVEGSQDHGLQLRPAELPDVAEALLSEGWSVEVHGASLRRPNPPALKVESGIDWFEVSGDVDFAGDRVEMRRLLAAVSKGERFIELEDGSQGVLPEAWMETYGSLSELAQEETEDGLRFLTSQAALVDALLAAMPPAQVDKAFAELREKLSSFERVEPIKEARGFKGTLRGYQRQGLGWLSFLREFGLGGVLADDMGLGKTVQVLAHLHAHRTPSKSTGLPSLVVAPRSLVYNWVDEAGRFTPKLKVVEYHGSDREQLQGKLGDYDLVVTTYGTLRRDIGFLSTVEFDSVVLDEAQAIKNPDSQTAKASRLLTGRHRLALTGTPIENHLGELGSLFEFLNPGLLGRMPRLDVLVSGGTPTREQLALVARGLRPFILRRTKSEVLADLPPKTEQVLFCSLRPEQRELYDALRAEYQASLLDQVSSKGVAGSTMQVLEALLRLRQVACHPGLVKDEWRRAGSAKLEALFEQVDEVLDEGHKVLVFSQFTSLLAYVREDLEQRGLPYAYLDGQTRDRAAPVERFQTDPECKLFLVSLKAGGTGLNLTAADYVFLLDPWWNPAVEAQAIDRAHRIGQTQPVFAYRMIARDTVEEKILDLQRSKKQLAETILEGGEGSGLGELTADDLKMLLS
ncbi:MAG: SNF2-related protein [Thermoanaerobaculia bacterium]